LYWAPYAKRYQNAMSWKEKIERENLLHRLPVNPTDFRNGS
jgi:hypothetical protein